jgi:hypothetical protein
MQRSLALSSLLALLVIAAPALVRAQFQTPTNEELRMTADPKAPGAAAVYLNIDETANDPQHYQIVYVRIKVLAEKGKELATVQIPFVKGVYKITSIKGRTIHSDGTIVPLNTKPEDLLIEKSGETTLDRSAIHLSNLETQIDRMVFNLPSVEVGSILEYKYELHYDDVGYSSPTWEVQRPYFVHKAHYAFTPYPAFLPSQVSTSSENNLVDAKGHPINSLIFWSMLPLGVSVKNDIAGRFSLDVQDVPPTPAEDWMPPMESFLYKVQFYYKNAFSADGYWVTGASQWTEDVAHFATRSKAIREVVGGLIAPEDSEMDKARKLYLAVQALDNTDFSRKRETSELKQLKLKEAKRAEDTWTQKSGDSTDIALLYLAMARAAGLEARAMKVADRKKRIFDSTFLWTSQLEDTIVLVTVAGKELVLDPGEKMCPFKTVSWRHSHATGFVEGVDGRSLSTTADQNYTENKTKRFGDFTVSADGGVKGQIRLVMIGQEALHWRQLALRNDPVEVKKSFDRWLATMVPRGVSAHIDHFIGLDDPEVQLLAFVKAEGALGAVTAKRILLPGFFFEAGAPLPFVSAEQRQTSVDMHYGEQLTDQVTYHLAAGMEVEGAPPEQKFLWKDHAVFATVSQKTPGQIVLVRSLARSFTFAAPSEYGELRGFYQKVSVADQQQLVLNLTPAGAGNKAD